MSRAEITTPEELSDESVVELSLRPQRLEEFIGQQKVKDNLRLAIDAALARSEPLDHSLFFGPPGLGKTTLAELIARELGVNIRTTWGPALEKPGDLVGTLTNLRAGDILFIDEIHRLRPIIEEFLYPAMEDYKIDIRLSEGPKAQTITMPIERFTLIGATTRFGMLTPPMRARFGIVERLNYYPVDDLDQIVTRSALVLHVEIAEGGAHEIARRPPRQGADRGDRGRRRARDRPPVARNTARRQPTTPTRARLRAGEGERRHHEGGRLAAASDDRRRRVRSRRHGRAHPENDHREVRGGSSGLEQHRRRNRRRRDHDRGSVRALPPAARIYPAH